MMKRNWAWNLGALVLIGALLADRGADATEPEVLSSQKRTYDILVDGKQAGQSAMVITRYRDGIETVVTDAKVTVSWLVFAYVYEFHGKETWRQGRLEELTSQAIDGGNKLSLTAKRTDDGFSLTKKKGKPAKAADVQLTTNYWREPAAEALGRTLTLLDADNGRVYEEHVERRGEESVTIGGKEVTAKSYRLQGKLDVELWFDSDGLLVRQLGKEDGHPTEVRLVSVEQTVAKDRSRER